MLIAGIFQFSVLTSGFYFYWFTIPPTLFLKFPICIMDLLSRNYYIFPEFIFSTKRQPLELKIHLDYQTGMKSYDFTKITNVLMSSQIEQTFQTTTGRMYLKLKTICENSPSLSKSFVLSRKGRPKNGQCALTTFVSI